MVVCICKSLTEKDLTEAIMSGCASFEDLVSDNAIATDCTICFSKAKEIFNKIKEEVNNV
jgi:bacterioferritin-associated ferredoxin|tara:strand:- start:2598 stop:2777 length:180 start_codon:yes stop_codon:yes gene_type:complete